MPIPFASYFGLTITQKFRDKNQENFKNFGGVMRIIKSVDFLVAKSCKNCSKIIAEANENPDNETIS